MSYRGGRARGRGSGGYNSNYRGSSRGTRPYNSRYSRGGGRYSRGKPRYDIKSTEQKEEDFKRKQEYDQENTKMRFKERFIHNWRSMMTNLEKVSEDGEINVLIVAQRPSVAQKICLLFDSIWTNKAADKSKAKSRRIELEGIYKSCPIYAFEVNFKGFIGNIKVTSVEENMYNVSFKDTVDLWNIDPKALFTEETVREPVSKLQCKHIQLSARKADVLVLWTDMSIEGENVWFEIIDNVKPKLPEQHDDYVFRAKFRSLASEDIADAYEKLIHKPNEYYSLSFDALKTIDLKIENAFTIFQTKRLLETFPTLEKITKKLVYDTCLMSALSLCVDRFALVKKNIQPAKFYSIFVLIKEAKGSFKTLDLEWRRGKLYDKNSVIAVFEEIKKEKYATVTEVTLDKGYIIEKPLALNTVNLLRQSSELLGINATETMKILHR